LLETGLNPRQVEVQMSSYGGGMLQGDRVALDIRCGAGTGLLLKSQANTHVYRNETGAETVQQLVARCEEHANVKVLPEPLVLHAQSGLRQFQQWDLAATTDFILVDWMQSGRSESEEQFAFSSFESHVLLLVDGKPVLEENLMCHPALADPRNAARFGPYDLLLSAYLLGPSFRERAHRLAPFLAFTQYHADALPLKGCDRLPMRLCALHEMPDGQGCVFRAMARRRLDLQPVLAVMATF